MSIRLHIYLVVNVGYSSSSWREKHPTEETTQRTRS